MIKGTKKVRTQSLNEIYMRDPFIFPDKESKVYYLFGTTSVADGAANIDPHFEVYKSTDLKAFEGPYVAFMPPAGYWGVKHYWAPEVFRHNNKYYMFASFKGGIGGDRGTGVLISETPYGPYLPHSKKHVTLNDNECLDGTLYFDKNNKPWIVFCHEWTQLYYGKIKALPLSDDLSESLSQEAITIVDTEKDNLPWIRHMVDNRVEKIGFLTDAPCLHRLKNGELIMLWSSYSIKGYTEGGFGGYAVAVCRSSNGDISGKWTHCKKLLLDSNIGHVSLFSTFENELTMVGHCNDTFHGSEYPVLIKMTEKDDLISLVGVVK